MLRLNRLRLDRFRGDRPSVDLTFSPYFNFLLGQNGTGKTTLLSLITALIAQDTQTLADLAGDEAIELQAWFTHERTPQSGSLLGDDGTYEIEFLFCLERLEMEELAPGIQGSRTSRTGRAEYAFVRKEDGIRASISIDHDGNIGADPPAVVWGRRFSTPRLVSRGLLLDMAITMIDSMTSEEARSQGPNTPRLFERKRLPLLATWTGTTFGRFDEALDTFARIVDPPGSMADSSLPTAAAVHRHGSSVSMQFVPMAFLRSNPTDGNSEWTGSLPEGEAPCSEIARALHADRVACRGRAIETRPAGAGGGITASYERFEFSVVWPGGLQQHHSRLSFGQKRMVAFFWYLAATEHLPVVADELANGLHYEYLEACLAAIGERQGFYALQNPLLLDMVPPVDVEGLVRSLVLCSMSSGDAPGRRWVWRNPNEAEGHRLWSGFETSLERLSAILRQEHLW